jgi:hypothetical protein
MGHVKPQAVWCFCAVLGCGCVSGIASQASWRTGRKLVKKEPCDDALGKCRRFVCGTRTRNYNPSPGKCGKAVQPEENLRSVPRQ